MRHVSSARLRLGRATAIAALLALLGAMALGIPGSLAFGAPRSATDASAPAVTLDPTSLDFGAQAVGTTSDSQTVTFTNSGTADLSISYIISATLEFPVTSSDCPVTLSPGSFCTLRIAFTPAQTGTRTGTLIFSDNAADSDQSVPLSGEGFVADQEAPTTTITLSPEDGIGRWHRSPAHVTVSASDDGSGVAETRCFLDPVRIPATFADLPSGCDYSGDGADISTDGDHWLYAASVDAAGNQESIHAIEILIDQTPPTITCDDATNGPVELGGASEIGAHVSDSGSGPTQTDVGSPADSSSVGTKSVALTGWDLAGNDTTVSCQYLVMYRLLGPYGVQSSYPAGSTIKGSFVLADYHGTPISDADAQAVANACKATFRFDQRAPQCARYDAKTNVFRFSYRITKRVAPGQHSITLEVYSGPDLLNARTVTFSIIS